MAASIPDRGEGSSRANPSEGTLGDAMRIPSKTPNVVVLDRIPDGLDTTEVLDPKEDLWLTTADGSPIIPLCVGKVPHEEIFQVHRDVLHKSEWFRKALCGGFAEASSQTLNLPEEDPAVFHFLIAYLYENTYVPTKALSTVLIPDEEKGKGPEREINGGSPDSDSDSSTSSALSDSSARSRQRGERHRRRAEREAERLRQKHPGMHRPQCSCPTCFVSLQPCFSCGFTSRVPQPNLPPPPPFIPIAGVRSHRHRRRGPDGRVLPGAASPPPPPSPYDPARIKGEDMHTWLIAYAFNLDVYICANKFLLADFKQKIARVTIDMLETAGSDAATIEVLELCTKLYDGVSEGDPLLKMVFARVGFLQTTLWRNAPLETNQFLIDNPEVAALVLKEMAIRGEGDLRSGIPSMEKNHMPQPPMMPGMHPPYRGHPNRHRPFY
ncbi:hypothetical protein N0V93_001191 [Gnomoniopsis smithogilvyi]|uniref:BTB domain-containing protein n=1 Tax=Gnomoniopsis smithogilvyi TaxID=1191159 RepID=A0A9W8Z3F1_9PEZI|nr:hypothetical protein N0V93_001191 [Gnomoniopsis smithogilvyi]